MLIDFVNKLMKLSKPTSSIIPQNDKNSIIGWVIDELEGGDKIISDTGGLTKFGISSKANSDVDVRNLTRAKAISLYDERYWTKYGCGDFPYPYNLILFDAGVNSGSTTVSALKIMYAAKNPWQNLLFYRLQYYSRLMDGKTKYDIYAEGWLNRILKIYKKLISEGF